jgi:hypothetical protein
MLSVRHLIANAVSYRVGNWRVRMSFGTLSACLILRGMTFGKEIKGSLRASIIEIPEEAKMFKRIILALTCIAAFSVASIAMPEKADAGWRYRSRPYRSYYYGPRYGYYRPYRSYYRSYYRPRYYYDSYYGYPDSYYYGYPRYYSYGYPDYYYYSPRSSVSVSFGF